MPYWLPPHSFWGINHSNSPFSHPSTSLSLSPRMQNLLPRFRKQEWGIERRKTYSNSCSVSNQDSTQKSSKHWGSKGRDKYQESRGHQASFLLRTIGNIKVKSKDRLEGWAEKPQGKKQQELTFLKQMLNTLILALNNNAGWSVHSVNTFNTILIFSLLQEPQIVMATKQKNRSQY